MRFLTQLCALALVVSPNVVYPTDSSLSITNDPYVTEFINKYKSSYLEQNNGKIKIYAHPSISNWFNEALLSSILLLPLAGCAGILKFANIPAQDRGAVTFSCLLLGAVCLGAEAFVLSRLYKKFGYPGPVIEFDAEGFIVKGQRVFSWKDVDYIEMDKVYIDNNIYITKIEVFNKFGENIYNINNSNFALPSNINIRNLSSLVEHFTTTYVESVS